MYISYTESATEQRERWELLFHFSFLFFFICCVRRWTMTEANIGNRFYVRCMQYFNSLERSAIRSFFMAESGSGVSVVRQALLFIFMVKIFYYFLATASSCILPTQFYRRISARPFFASLSFFLARIQCYLHFSSKMLSSTLSLHLHEWRKTFFFPTEHSYYTSYFMRKKMKMAIRRIYSYGIEQTTNERNEHTDSLFLSLVAAQCVCVCCIVNVACA